MQTDAQLQHDILAELRWEPSVTHDRIHVAVADGIVTLSGVAANYAEKIAAENRHSREYGHVAYHTRHTLASLALIGGVNVAYLARQLGHANAGMLFKHYARWIEDDEATRQSKRLNEAFTAADSPISDSRAPSR